MHVTESLRRFLFANFLVSVTDTELDDGASLLEAGIIDSTGILEVVAFLEEAFGIVVDDAEITPENFDSIDRLACYVGRKQAKIQEPASQT